MTNIVINGQRFVVNSEAPVDHIVLGLTQTIGGPNHRVLSAYDPAGARAADNDPTVVINQWTDSVIDFDHGIWPELYASQILAGDATDGILLSNFDLNPDQPQSSNVYTVSYDGGTDVVTIQSTDFDMTAVDTLSTQAGTTTTLAVVTDYTVDNANQISIPGASAALGAGTLTVIDFNMGAVLVSEWLGSVPLTSSVIAMSAIERPRLLALGAGSIPGADQFALVGAGGEDLSSINSVFVDTGGLSNNINVNGRWSLPDAFNLWIDHLVIAAIVSDGSTLDAVRAFDSGMNLIAQWTGPITARRLPVITADAITSPSPGILRIDGDSLDTIDRIGTQPNAFPDVSGGMDLAWNPTGPSAANNATVISGRGCTINSWTSGLIEIDYGVGAAIPIPGINGQSAVYALPFEMGQCAADVTITVLSNP